MAEAVLPCAQLAHWWHELQLPESVSSPESRAEAKAKLLAQIEKDAMAPLYRKAMAEFGWPADEEKLKHMETLHAEQLKDLETKLCEAKQNYGDIEVRDALINKAHFFSKIGDLPKAVEAYGVAYEKTVGVGSRIDITLTLLHIGFVYGDKEIVKKNLQLAREEIAKGGDWERRNKLRVFEGVACMLSRNFSEASKLFLGILSTFPSGCLLTFKQFIFYSALLALLCCDRQTLKEQVLFAPPVLEGGDSDLKNLLSCFYYGKYREFMTYLVPVGASIRRDIYLSKHFRYLIRAIRLRVYKQFLEPYKSVTLENMASAFGVSLPFIEEEVAGFVASGKLSCRIDRVKGIIEANRPDERSSLYLQTIKQGDVLLNRIQKLARVLAV